MHALVLIIWSCITDSWVSLHFSISHVGGCLYYTMIMFQKVFHFFLMMRDLGDIFKRTPVLFLNTCVSNMLLDLEDVLVLISFIPNNRTFL